MQIEMERMSLRMAEMAAHIESLQAVIDEANAQEPFGWFVDVEYCGFTRIKPNIYADSTIALYARPIPARQLKSISVDDKQFLIEWCEQQIRSNILDAKTYYGGDTSQEARARNHERQEQSKKDVVKFQRLMDFFYGLGEVKQQSQEVSVPDDWEAVGGDYDKSIHNNPSADAWAEFFIKTFPRLKNKRDLIHGWFANAMMAMHDSIKSPSITEQDAREIAKVLRDIVANYECGDDVDKKIISALNKLNAKQEESKEATQNMGTDNV